MTVGLISDTHGLICDAALDALAGVDLILHAGDVGSKEVLRALGNVAPVRAVRGNADAAIYGEWLAESIVVEVGGQRLYVLHDIDRLDLDPEEAGLSAVVYGHSHHPAADMVGGVLYINPGSAGTCYQELPGTVALLQIDESGLMGHKFVTLK